MSEAEFAQVHTSAKLLYGLIHQRFVLTRPGLTQLVRFPLAHARVRPPVQPSLPLMHTACCLIGRTR